MLDKQLINNILDRLLSKGGEYADIYLEKEDIFSFVLENNKIKSFKTGDETGAHLRVINKHKTFSSYTNEFSRDSLYALADNIAQALDTQDHVSVFKPLKSVRKWSPDSLSFKGIDDRLDLFLSNSRSVFESSELITQATFNYLNSVKNIAVFNSAGQDCSDKRQYSRYSVNIVAADGDRTQAAYEGPGLTGKDDILQRHPLPETVGKVRKRVLSNLKARQAPTGKMPVILLGEAGGTMIHEACGHGLEADFIYKQTSIFNGKVGEQVASDCVTVIDDGSLPGLYGSYSVDDEGSPSGKTVLIEKGILKGFITDRMSSKLLGLPLTGNGRRESFRSKPIPRMSNTFIENGIYAKEDIIASVQNGLLVKRMGGGQVNITNGDFIFEVMEGYLIENGKVTEPIRGASLIGNGPEVLMSIDMVGNDKYFIPGVCGKYDYVPVADAQPTLRIPNMTIGGT